MAASGASSRSVLLSSLSSPRLARALVQEAPTLVLDEPTTSLHLGHSQLLLELVDERRADKNYCELNVLKVACGRREVRQTRGGDVAAAVSRYRKVRDTLTPLGGPGPGAWRSR